MNPREQYLTERFNEWLDRFSPPRAIQNNPKAMQDDANAMLAIVLRHAPNQEYGEWLERTLTTLAEGMTTRSWPAPGELTKACRTKGDRTPEADKNVEELSLNRCIEWYLKFGSQMPGMGNTGRTTEMIRRGIFGNEREARFHGFDLTDDQRNRSNGQTMGKAEWVHHVKVMARLRGVSEYEAAEQERAEMGDIAPRRGVSIPNKRSVPMEGAA